MITRITGTLNRVLDDEVRLQVGPYERQVLVAEFVRRQLQTHTGEELTLSTLEYLEGGAQATRMIPRLIGFLHEDDLDFFELFCTVDGIGPKKGLKALARPSKEVADAIRRKDAKWLTTMPGIGKAMAEKVIAALATKVTRFAMLPAEVAATPEGAKAAGVAEDAYQALLSVGHSPGDARDRLDKALAGGKTFKSVDELLLAIYSRE